MTRSTAIFLPFNTHALARRGAIKGLRMAAAGALLVATSAQAAEPGQTDPGRGWYIEAIAGMGWLGDTGYSVQDSAGQSLGDAGELTLDPGVGAGLGIGYDFGRWRLEGEYLYQTNDIDELNLAGLPAGTDGGDFSSVVISANLIGEWNLLPGNRARSYAGIGLAWVQEVDIDFATPDGEISFSTDDVGVQLLAGVDYRLSARWFAALEGRYLAAGGLDLDGEGEADGVVSTDYDRTSVLLSLRYQF